MPTNTNVLSPSDRQKQIDRGGFVLGAALAGQDAAVAVAAGFSATTGQAIDLLDAYGSAANKIGGGAAIGYGAISGGLANATNGAINGAVRESFNFGVGGIIAASGV